MAVSSSLVRAPNLDDWISIGPDGRVCVRTGKVDIGQRISTALALIAAEELDVDLSRIDVARAETGRSPDEGVTSGSMSMEDSGSAVRLAAATARALLLSLAAKALDVDLTSLDIDDGIIQSRASNRSVSYWELTGGKRFGIPVDPDARLKAPAAYRVVGTKVVPREMEEIATGSYAYVHDMELAGMLHARVVHPPNYNARLVSLDEAQLAHLRDGGVQIVRDGSFLAVAHSDEFAAVKAARSLGFAARWNEAQLDPGDVFQKLVSNPHVSLPVIDGTPVSAPVPPPLVPPNSAVTTISARYERPYHMHGSIGPSAALAQYKDGRLTIWSHSQGITILQACVADAMRMEAGDVHVVHVPGAGCYGHNGADDAAFDAALVARAIPGKPVLLKWSREDEHAFEPYGPAMVMDLSGSVDASGTVVAWSHETFSDTHVSRPRPDPNRQGASRLLSARFLSDPLTPPLPQPAMGPHVGIHRNQEPLYRFANTRFVKTLVRDLPLRVSALRTLGGYANVFALESFMDELADAAGLDPIAFRLRHLSDERAKAVITAAASALDAPLLPAGRGRGLGFARYKNVKTYCAVGIELEVTDRAEIKLHRAVIAADAGQVVDPNGLTQQLEGGLMQAASWTLYEQVTWDQDGITSRDWDSYPVLRFDNVPKIETTLIDQPGAPFLGAGEAAGGPTAAAIANAVYRASGLRLRRIPFTPETIRHAAIESPVR